jgi:integrase
MKAGSEHDGYQNGTDGCGRRGLTRDGHVRNETDDGTERVEIYDSKVPGFGVRIGDAEDKDPSRRGKAGRITFVLYARFSAGSASARRTIGVYGALSLERAREIAGEWRGLIGKGIDPAAAEAERIATAQREAAAKVKNSFSNVCEDFIVGKLSKERKGKPVERDLRGVFIKAWGDRPISEITDLDVLEIINRKKLKTPQMARHLLTIIKRFFNWAIDQRIYGLKTSPCDRLKPTSLIGEKVFRNRRLSDVELFAFWRATERMPYPTGAVYQLLALTALRLNECAEISWPEIRGDILTVSAARMKGRDSKAREFVVPLSQMARDVIENLPRGNAGPYLFSYSNGESPLRMTSRIKEDLDRRMLRTLRALARQRGKDPRAVGLVPWVNHDLRRTIRSTLSALRVPQNVAEAVLSHVAPGIIGIYNVYEFLDEKREALELWAKYLDAIVHPDRGNNVVPLSARR